VQGLADAFMALHMPFDSPAVKQLNIQIFEMIYHGVLEASIQMAEKDGLYETWVGSPAQQGQLQFDLWGVTPTDLWDWAMLKEKIVTTGLRNSLLTAPMPTASTSQILGFNECFEPYTRYGGTRFLYIQFLTNGIYSLATSTPIKSSLGSSKWSAHGFSENLLTLVYEMTT